MPKGHKRTKEQVEVIMSTLYPVIQRTGSFRKACVHMKIPYESINRYRLADEVIGMKVQEAEKFRQLLAEKSLFKSISEGDINSAKWMLERIDKKVYSTREEITGRDGESLGVKGIPLELLPKKSKKRKP